GGGGGGGARGRGWKFFGPVLLGGARGAASAARSPVRRARRFFLLVPQGLDRVEFGCRAGGIESEDDADAHRDAEREGQRPERHVRLHFLEHSARVGKGAGTGIKNELE